MSLSMILKFFLNFGRFEPCDSYKLYSYKKESVYRIIVAFVKFQNIKNSRNKFFGNFFFLTQVRCPTLTQYNKNECFFSQI